MLRRLCQRWIHLRPNCARASRHLIPIQPCGPPLSSPRESVRVSVGFQNLSLIDPLTSIIAYQSCTPHWSTMLQSFTLFTHQSLRPSTLHQSSTQFTTLQSCTLFTPHQSSRPSTLPQSFTQSTKPQSCSTTIKSWENSPPTSLPTKEQKKVQIILKHKNRNWMFRRKSFHPHKKAQKNASGKHKNTDSRNFSRQKNSLRILFYFVWL